MDKVELPNFLVVGVAKSGTTSLFDYLNQHPEVYVPSCKETFFFISSVYKNINSNDPARRKGVIFNFHDYLSLYKSIDDKKAIGEVGTGYLYFYDIAIPMIEKHLGNTKIVAILRNPIDRAYSSYHYFAMYFFEPFIFEKALKQEKNRKNDGWDFMWLYKDLGFYYKQIKAYKKHFDEVRVYLYDDLKSDTITLMQDMYEFLEADSSFVPDVSVKYNVTGVPKNMFFYKFLTKPNIFKSMIKPIVKAILPEEKRVKLVGDLRAKNLNLIKPQMEPETREYLKKIYREDILKLQNLINRDLSHWLR